MFYDKFYFLVFLFFIQINPIFSNDVTIYATNDIYVDCEEGLYSIELIVKFSSEPQNKYISFPLTLESPYELKLKCLINYQNSSIICITNLNSNSFDLELGEFIEFPILFPEVEGIIWDYDSFAKNIYGKGWIVDNDCDPKPIDLFINSDWGLIFNITDIFDEYCDDPVDSIETKFNFKLKGNFISNDVNNINGLLNNDDEIEFLQDIWIPILIKTSKIRYKKIDYFSFAFCPFKYKLDKSNINNEFIFDCYVPIPEGKFLIGGIQIKSFYDFFYFKLKDKEELFFDNIFFNLNRTIEKQQNIPEKNEIEYESDITNNNNSVINNTITTTINNKYITLDYFLVGENENGMDKIYCPDKPFFVISNSEEGIRLNKSERYNYTFALQGMLFIRNQNSSEARLYNDIYFNLYLIDNLAENEDNQISEANCIIPTGTPFYHRVVVFCSANKISEESMMTNDTDISLNWNLEKNRLHQDLIIKWPEEKKRIKHMYSYTLTGYSLAQENYGCYKNKFYFYIYIENLNFEPDIEFEIQLKNPLKPKAVCKIYESSILKCQLDLLLYRLEKGTQIDLKINSIYDSIDDHGNKVTFIVDDYDYDYEDFHLILQKTCGNIFILGFFEKEGINRYKVITIVLCIICFVVIVFICIVCYIVYKIKGRFMKGKYMRYVEEEGSHSRHMDNNINNKIDLKDKKTDAESNDNKIK